MNIKTPGSRDIMKNYNEKLDQVEKSTCEEILQILDRVAIQGFKPDTILLRVIKDIYGRDLDLHKFQYLLTNGMWPE